MQIKSWDAKDGTVQDFEPPEHDVLETPLPRTVADDSDDDDDHFIPLHGPPEMAVVPGQAEEPPATLSAWRPVSRPIDLSGTSVYT